ncbi:hypothetical protein BGZ60DRAFT_411451 [Tricladium varicosporioides]|nr:hypothetical protein BGZ60DRAFT_411451 [Hymenoscyphus varicosporioides]
MKDKEDTLEQNGVRPVLKGSGALLKSALTLGACCLVYFLWTNRHRVEPLWRKPEVSKQELWIQDVVDLITDLYTLLEGMAYLPPKSISYPPHINPAINNTLAARIGLSSDAILLLEKLPYVMIDTNWNAYRYKNELLLTTQFADMRDDWTLRKSRDPWHPDTWHPRDEEHFKPNSSKDEEVLGGLKPWEVALSGVDRINSWMSDDQPLRGANMILNLKTRHLFTIGDGAGKPHEYNDGSYENRGSVDPVTRDMLAHGENLTFKRTTRARVSHYASRPATEALSDYIHRFKTLEWVPGFVLGDSQIGYACDTYRQLYREHGWPSNFNKVAFEDARKAWHEKTEAQYKATEPIRELQRVEWQLKSDGQKLDLYNKHLENIVNFVPDPQKPWSKAKTFNPDSGRYIYLTEKQTLNSKEIMIKRIREGEERKVELNKIVEGIDPKLRNLHKEIDAKYRGFHQLAMPDFTKLYNMSISAQQ